MQERFYTNDRNTLILLALLKANGIRKVIASPGTTNIALVASMQYDGWFELYSAVDERSAAYMACGMAEASGEPVVITCTGATASRNYFPGLTEAYYRKLPVLAITGSHGEDIIGHLHAQSIDRSQAPKDTIIYSTSIRIKDSEWKVNIECNKAIIALKQNGGGPVHIDLESAAYGEFKTRTLPKVRKIKIIKEEEKIPDITGKKVAIFMGAHRKFSNIEVELIENFCERCNSVVFVDHTSGYYGNYAINYALVACQFQHRSQNLKPDIFIHIGEVSGEFYTSYSARPHETWRLAEDGQIKDRFSNLSCVLQMSISAFFGHFSKLRCDNSLSYYEDCKAIYEKTYNKIPELPFSNVWIAKYLHDKIPANSELFFSIFNSLRSWNFFRLPNGIASHCNVGGFGIDGAMSTMIGSSIVFPKKLHFLVTGDLAFFYDLNSLGNRHIGNNCRILLINNGIGIEFKHFDHPGSKWGENANLYIAAEGHFGCKSGNLVKHYAEDLGFMYLSAKTKEDFDEAYKKFTNPNLTPQPILFEIFTEEQNEKDALFILRNTLEDERNFCEKTKSVGNYIKNKIAKI